MRVQEVMVQGTNYWTVTSSRARTQCIQWGGINGRLGDTELSMDSTSEGATTPVKVCFSTKQYNILLCDKKYSVHPDLNCQPSRWQAEAYTTTPQSHSHMCLKICLCWSVKCLFSSPIAHIWNSCDHTYTTAIYIHTVSDSIWATCNWHYQLLCEL